MAHRPGNASGSRLPSSPLFLSVDPARIGGVLLLTSACDAQVEKDLGLERKQKAIKGVNEDSRLQADDLHIPGGGKYRAENQETYVRQAVLGGQFLAEALIEAGVPEDVIFFEHFEGRDDHPGEVVRNFFSSLPLSHPDAILYYSGPTDSMGNFALGWTNHYGFNRSAKLGPEDVMFPSGPGDGPPGNRSYIIEASNTIRWMQPSPRTMGLAAWEGVAIFGGSGGPPLVRWLLGESPVLPRGAAFCSKSVSTGSRPGTLGLLALPCYKLLFWGAEPGSGPEAAKKAADCIWELDVFTAPARGGPDQVAACEEVLCRGGAKVLCSHLMAHAAEAGEQEALLLQMLKILHRLVIHTNEDRWLGAMEEVLSTALNTISTDHCPGTLYASALSLATACASVCESASRAACKHHWKEIDHIICSSLKGEHGALAAVTACQLVTQVVSIHPLDHGEDAEILNLLQSALVGQWEEQHAFAVKVAAADALVFASLHCDTVKLQVLENLAHTGELLPMLETGSAELVAKVLMLLRSLAACEPREVVAEDLAHGTTEALIDALSAHPNHMSVQRWGLAALGALAQASASLAAVAARNGGCDCVVWALGADLFVSHAEVHREGLFCAHSLLRDEKARKLCKRPSSRLPGLVSAILARSLESPAQAATEVPLWGARVLERLASSPGGGASAVEPYLDALVLVMRTPNCRNATVLAATCAIAHLTNGSPVAYDRLKPFKVLIQKELQRRASIASAAGERAAEFEFQDWARVIVDGLGGHKLCGIDEDAGDPPIPLIPDSEEEDDE